MTVRFALWHDKLLLVALGLFFFAQSTYIRVTLRSAFEGSSFGWGYFSGLQRSGEIAMVRGEGFNGHTDYLAAKTFIVLLILLLGLRRPDGVFRLALVLWTSLSLGIAAWVITMSNEAVTVSKETLGLVNVPAGVWLLLPPGLAWVAALLLFVRDWGRPAPASSAWGLTNTVLIAAGVLALAASAYLLNAGPQHGSSDFLGIGVMYLSLTFMLAGFAPWDEVRP
jgi:hypothetical protein